MRFSVVHYAMFGKTKLIKISLYGKMISNPDPLKLMKSIIFIGKPHDGLLVKAILF